ALIFMPIGFATENHETLLDVEHIMGHLQRQRPDVTYVQMPCVNDHPEFLKMAADWANTHIADLLNEQAVVVNPQLATVQPRAIHTHDHEHGHHHHHDGHHH
ncbi:MAG TPA: ferrochelatase, partial [Elainellaceae cyanobacterium]